MAAIITDQQQVPPDLVLMPGGHGIPISQFFAEHGDNLTPFANTKVAVATPRLKVGGELDDTVQATIGLAIGYVTFLVTKSLEAEKYLAPPITAFVAKDAAHWVEHHLEHGSDVRLARWVDGTGTVACAVLGFFWVGSYVRDVARL